MKVGELGRLANLRSASELRRLRSSRCQLACLKSRPSRYREREVSCSPSSQSRSCFRAVRSSRSGGGVVTLMSTNWVTSASPRRLSGVRLEKVAVMSLGAAAHFDGSYRNGREQARMALGGLQAPFAIALALVLLNVAIGVLSLLPFHPLDGHKLIVGLVWWVVGSEARARRIIRRVGFSLLAVDASAVVLLLAARPLMGVTVAAVAAVAFAQKRLVGARPRHR